MPTPSTSTTSWPRSGSRSGSSWPPSRSSPAAAGCSAPRARPPRPASCCSWSACCSSTELEGLLSLSNPSSSLYRRSAVPGGLDQALSRLDLADRHEALPRDRDGDRPDARVAAGKDAEAAGDAVADRGRAHGVDYAGALRTLRDRVEQDARGLPGVWRVELDRAFDLL